MAVSRLAEAAAFVASEYSGKASAYARHWAPTLREFALPLLDMLPLATARSVLEVACGTGGLLQDIADVAPHCERLVGSDIASGMLQAARSRTHADLALMDVTSLGFQPATFDVVVLAFALFHMVDPPRALREVRRVLVPGGKAGIVVWGPSAIMPATDIWTEELERVGAPPEPRRAEVNRHAEMDTPEKLADLFKEAGYSAADVTVRQVEREWAPGDLLEVQTSCAASARRLNMLTEEAREACIAAAWARLSDLAPEERVFRPQVLFAIGTA